MRPCGVVPAAHAGGGRTVARARRAPARLAERGVGRAGPGEQCAAQPPPWLARPSPAGTAQPLRMDEEAQLPEPAQPRLVAASIAPCTVLPTLFHCILYTYITSYIISFLFNQVESILLYPPPMTGKFVGRKRAKSEPCFLFVHYPKKIQQFCMTALFRK